MLILRGSTYKGHPVHAIMGKSLKPLLEGSIEKVHADDESVSQEMFNNTAVWMAVRNFQPVGDGEWHLFNITSDIGENTDISTAFLIRILSLCVKLDNQMCFYIPVLGK